MLTYNIALPTPFVTIEGYIKISGLPEGTIKQYISQGRIIVKKKETPGERTLINLVAMHEIAAREALAVLG